MAARDELGSVPKGIAPMSVIAGLVVLAVVALAIYFLGGLFTKNK